MTGWESLAAAFTVCTCCILGAHASAVEESMVWLGLVVRLLEKLWQTACAAMGLPHCGLEQRCAQDNALCVRT